MAKCNNHKKRVPPEKQKPGSIGAPLNARLDAIAVIKANMERLLTNLETGTNILPGTYKKAVEVLKSCSLYCTQDEYDGFRLRMAEYHKKRLVKLIKELEQGTETDTTCQEAIKELQSWAEFMDSDTDTKSERRQHRAEYNEFAAKLKPFADKNMRAFLQMFESGNVGKDVYKQATAMLEALIALSGKPACKLIIKELNQYRKMAK